MSHYTSPENVTLSAIRRTTAANNETNCLGRTSNIIVYNSHMVVVFIVLTAIFCCFAFFGNVTVIAAIVKDRVISKHKQHLYLLSLAVADTLLVVLVVPFSLTNELLGYWPFGDVYCRIYLSLDILLCTASICNICCIGVDRFVSVKYPTKYKKHRRITRIRRGIIFVWIYAAAVSLLPFTGKTEIIKRVNQECFINDSPWFILLSSSLSFFIPACGIGTVYINIFFIGREVTERNLRRKNLVKLNSPINAVKNAVEQSSPNDNQPKCSKTSLSPSKCIHFEENNSPPALDDQAQNEDLFMKLDPIFAKPNEIENNVNHQVNMRPMTWRYGNFLNVTTQRKMAINEENDEAKVFPEEKEKFCPEPVRAAAVENENCKRVSVNFPVYSRQAMCTSCSVKEDQTDASKLCSFLRSCCFKICSNEQTERPRSSLSPSSDRCKHRNHFSKNRFSKSLWAASNRRKDSALVRHASTMTSLKRFSRSRREKRFIFIILVVTGVFLLCWTPFFTTYIVYALCRDECCIDQSMFKFFFWVGYLNSGINPVLYTVFNKDFRQAFKRLFTNSTFN